MKKNLKVILIATVLATNSIFVTACSNSNDKNIESNNEKGGFLETDISLPEEIVHIQSMFYINNNINLIARTKENNYKKFVMQEDNTFLQEDLPKSLNDILNDNNQIITDVAYIDEDSYILLSSVYENTNEASMNIKTIMKIIQGENVKDISLQEGNYSSLVVNNNEIFLINGEKGLERYDLEGNLLKSYNNEIFTYTVVNNEIITLNLKEKSLVIYDLETGEEKNNISKPNLDYSDILSVDSNNNIYICGKNGFEKLLKDRATFEKVVDGNSTSLGIPTNFVSNIISIDEKQFLGLFFNSSEGNKLIKYQYDENYNKNFKASLNVYMLQDNPFIKQAIFNYKKSNPDVAINIQVGYDEHNGITKEDAIKNLNTEILSGKGPDIIVLDGLNADNYIEKGALLDISDVITPLIDSGEILENIVNPFIEDGKIYTIPTRFSPSTIWGTNEILKNYTGLDSLAKWQQENKEKMVFYPTKPEELIKETFKINTQILNDDGSLNENELKKYLENIKILSSDKELDVVIETELDKNIAGLEYLAYKDAELQFQNMTTITELDHSYASIKMNGDATYMVNNGYFTPLNMIGINSKCENVDIAKDIIKTALNEETQKIDLLLSEGGFTVNKKVFDSFKVIEEKDDNMATKLIAMVSVDPNRMLDLSTNRPTDEDKVKFYEIIEKVSKPTKEDSVLMNFIIEESKGYFKGEKDIEETTKAILQKANTYLAE